MSNIPPIVSEEQLPGVQITPYHPHNSVNLPKAESLYLEANAPALNLQAAGFKRTLQLFG